MGIREGYVEFRGAVGAKEGRVELKLAVGVLEAIDELRLEKLKVRDMTPLEPVNVGIVRLLYSVQHHGRVTSQRSLTSE